MQANVNPTLAPKEWNLEALSDKMKQYCYQLDDLTAELLAQEANSDYEELRDYLRQRAVDAYWEKVLQCVPEAAVHIASEVTSPVATRLKRGQ